MRITICWLGIVLTMATVAVPAARADGAAEKIRLLIVDGQNNHDWRATTPYLKFMFEASGRFQVEVATAPPSPQTPEGQQRFGNDLNAYRTQMSQFRPEFERFDVIVLNYNGDPWPDATHDALESAVKDGKGLVVIHAADNSFPGRLSYDRMIGLAWRPPEFGVRLEFDAHGQAKRIEPGQGLGSGHGKRRPFQVVVRNSDHPITHGMPDTWMHARDELYHRLRGPAEEMTVLATAFDDPAEGGTGAHEPVAWTVAFGKGRVFHTPLGHDRDSMRCVGFITMVLRGAEWAAAGNVTVGIPADFPTADRVSTRGGWWSDFLEQASAIAGRFWPVAIVLAAGIFVWLRLRRQKKHKVAPNTSKPTNAGTP